MALTTMFGGTARILNPFAGKCVETWKGFGSAKFRLLFRCICCMIFQKILLSFSLAASLLIASEWKEGDAPTRDESLGGNQVSILDGKIVCFV